MLKPRSLVQLALLVVAAAAIVGAIWRIADPVPKGNWLAHIEIQKVEPSHKGAMPVVTFDLSGTPPVSQEKAYIDLLGPDSESVDIHKDIRFGVNQIDFNTDLGAVPSGSYRFRVLYAVPGGTLADTTVAAISEPFDIK